MQVRASDGFDILGFGRRLDDEDLESGVFEESSMKHACS